MSKFIPSYWEVYFSKRSGFSARFMRKQKESVLCRTGFPPFCDVKRGSSLMYLGSSYFKVKKQREGNSIADACAHYALGADFFSGYFSFG
ncbi:hypothetical protein KFK09_001725 [Dendrobium nobile]|uniref:Uncharacterized protein n=1 Tax=Dendrobium nobile TaxID=94219 RepID=A0A8T3C889_DENNO|nr:hypothetical protein KFK09_001725 [Dendrobium nobile]